MDLETKQLLEGLKSNTEKMRKDYEDLKSKSDTASTEWKAKEEKYNNEFTELKNKMTDLENKAAEEKKRADELELKLNRPGHSNPDPNAEKKEMQKKSFEKYLRYGAGESSKTAWKPEEVKALSEMIDSNGGYLAPAQFENTLITVAANTAEIRSVAGQAPTTRDKVQMPKLKQRTVIGWSNDVVAVSPQDLKHGLEEMSINPVTALVLVPNDLLEDSAVDVYQYLSNVFGEDIAVAEDDAFAIGSGLDRPEGFATLKSIQTNAFKSGDASALKADALISALYGLKKLYRKNATWAMNSTTEGVVRTMKDQYGQYLWQIASIGEEVQTTILGHKIINPESMDDVAGGKFPVVIGDFSRGYQIRDRRGIVIQRLIERYAEYRQTGFLVTKRVGGQVVLDEAFRAIKISS